MLFAPSLFHLHLLLLVALSLFAICMRPVGGEIYEDDYTTNKEVSRRFLIKNETIGGTMLVDQISVELQYGDAVENLRTHCHLFVDLDSCFEVMDTLSFNLYDILYTPSRPTSKLEDFVARRWDIVKYLITRYSYKQYLEIGCDNDETFSSIRALDLTLVVGVDPVSGGTHRTTSDDFFLGNQKLFDIIFIDGDHRALQVMKDIQNSLRFLSLGGSIVLHDCKLLLLVTLIILLCFDISYPTYLLLR
jgi:hypothetical protein